MNLEFSLSILAAIISLIAAGYSWLQVINKKKAEDTFVEIVRHEIDPEKQKNWEVAINDIKESNTDSKSREISSLSEMAKLNQKQVELIIKRQQELEKLRGEIAILVEKLDAQQKQLIFESVNQPSKKGQIAYLEKILARINPNAVLESKE